MKIIVRRPTQGTTVSYEDAKHVSLTLRLDGERLILKRIGPGEAIDISEGVTEIVVGGGGGQHETGVGTRTR